MLANRRDAGRKLADQLSLKGIKDGLYMAIPRGGVVVAAEMKKRIDFPMDLIIPRKIGAPKNSELAVGAVAQDGTVIYDHNMLSRLGIKEKDLELEVKDQISEISRRMIHYRGSDIYPDYFNKEIVLVDDGVATGHTAMAALKSLKKMFKMKRLILAVPVAPPDTIIKLKKEVDEIICLLKPTDFYSVGQFYEDFKQTEDEEVIQILKEINKE